MEILISLVLFVLGMFVAWYALEIISIYTLMNKCKKAVNSYAIGYNCKNALEEKLISNCIIFLEQMVNSGKSFDKRKFRFTKTTLEHFHDQFNQMLKNMEIPSNYSEKNYDLHSEKPI